MKYRTILITFCTLILVACGGGSSSNDEDQIDDDPSTSAISGTLVVPESSAVSSFKALAKNTVGSLSIAASDACPNVPNGYEPLENTEVDFVDASDNVLLSSTTDECGLFTANVPEEVVQARAESSGNRDIVADVDIFANATGNVVSTIPSAASYQIASIQSVSDNEIAFAITDTVTNKAVIGIPNSAFEVNVNSSPTTINGIQSSASTADPASVSLILDASGSMNASARDEQGDFILDLNGLPFNRTRLTAIASHTFLDNVANGDETSVVAFGTDVFFIDDSVLTELDLVDQNDNPVAPYTFSADGFSDDPAQLRFIIDAYNEDSKLYGLNQEDDIHPDTPSNIFIDNFAPWGGATALYDAISVGIIETNARSNARKIVIAMSDGQNNSSEKDIDEIIAEANAANIPVYTVSYEAGDTDAMARIADETNATTFVINGADLSGAFQSIQTGITFQYVAGFSDITQAGDEIDLSLTLNGTSVNRSFTR